MLSEQEYPEMSEFPEEENIQEEVSSTEETSTPSAEDSQESSTEDELQEETVTSTEPEADEPVQEQSTEPEEPVSAEEDQPIAEESPQEVSQPSEESPQEEAPVAEDAPVENAEASPEEPVQEETDSPVQSEETVPAVETESVEEVVVAAAAEAASEEEKTAETGNADKKVAPPPPPPAVETIPEGIEESLWDKMKEILAGEKSNQQILSEAKFEDLLVLLDYFTNDPNILRHIPRVGLVKRTFDALKYGEEFSEDQVAAFQEKLAAFNQNRVEAQKVVEEKKKDNARLKSELLTTLKEIVGSEDPMRIKEVREIQDKWREIGQVPRDQMDTLYREYRSTLDDFYKRRELHFEMLDYDRRKNLQDKERLIVEARNLIPAEEEREENSIWKQKMDALSELQQQWKSIGHVPREDMERVNNEYRSVVDQFFEIRSVFLGKLDEEREGNATKKEELLAQMAKFAEFQAERPKEWNEATRELKTYQDTWKETGQAPYAVNNDLWNRYRAICDAFFSKKAEFFKKFDEFRSENLQKKRALCERAEELSSSSEWEKSAKELKSLQKDWKAIGPVPERHSNKLWNRFRAACDAFFEGRRAHYQKMHEGEYANLESKKVLIEEVKKLTEEQNQNIEEAIERVKGIQREWKEIGKVPYKEKDKIWEVFRKQVDEFFNGLSAKRNRMRDVVMSAKLEDMNDENQRSAAIKERVRRYRRKIGQAQEKVDQYSTNIDFIAKGKSGDALRAQIQKQIDDEIEQIKEWKKKIKELNELAKKPIVKEEPKPEPVVEEVVAEEPVAEEPTTEEVVVEETPADETAAAEGVENSGNDKGGIPQEEADAPAEETEDNTAEEAAAAHTVMEESASEETESEG